MIADLQIAVRLIIRMASRAAHAVGQSYLVGSPLVLAVLVLFVAPAPASGQNKPQPPAQLCVEEAGNCGSEVDNKTVPKKWNPGHYLKVQGNTAQSDREGYFSSVTRQLAMTGDSPKILGAQVKYAWGMIERSSGNYDWEPIHRHLDYLSSHGKKMILTIDTKCFSRDCSNLSPSDLDSEVFLTPRVQPTSIIEIWEARNMDSLIAFMQALAVEFDSNPALEMVLSSESATSLQGGKPTNYTRSKYAKQLKRMYTAQAVAFKTTNVVATINYLSGEVSGLVEHAFQAGVGRGMPDIEESAGAFVFRDECLGKDCGVRDYRGLLPHFGLVSSPTLNGRFGPIDNPEVVIAYGLANKITHYSWVPAEIGEDSWANIIAAIERANPNGYTACPEKYAGGCQ